MAAEAVMEIAFTATRKGLRDPQSIAVVKVILRLQEETTTRLIAHLGDCHGGDVDLHAICTGLGLMLVGHPCHLDKQRAFLKYDRTYVAQLPLVRNKVMVDSSKLLIVCPGKMTEELRSGTWATWRYARQQGCEWIMIYPDGSTRRSEKAFSSGVSGN